MAQSILAVQTTSQEDLLEVTSSDQTENIHEEETKTFPTFGFDVKTQKTDLKLTFGKHRLYVKKSLLEDASSVFEEMFEEKLAGKTDQEVIMEDVSCEDFAEFLACIQRKGKRKIANENVYRMLQMATKYDVEDLKERCEFCLLDKLDEEKQNQTSVLQLFHLANENDMPSLKSMCMERADWKILDAMQEKDKDFNLSSNTWIELVGQFLPGLLSKSHLLDFLETSSDQKTSKIWGFDNAKCFKTRCRVSTHTVKETFKLCDTTWNLKVGSAAFYPFRPWYIQLTANPDIKSNNSSNMFKIGIACRILNYMPKQEDCRAFKIFANSETLDSSVISWNCIDDMEMSAVELQKEKLGFSYNGKYDIKVSVLMTKPEITIP